MKSYRRPHKARLQRKLGPRAAPGHGPSCDYGSGSYATSYKAYHCVSISRLSERVLGPDIALHNCTSEVMAADILKKHFVNREKWEHVCMLIGVCTVRHMPTLKPFKHCSPACVAVSAPQPAMSGAASSSDVSASLAKARTRQGVGDTLVRTLGVIHYPTRGARMPFHWRVWMHVSSRRTYLQYWWMSDANTRCLQTATS